MAREMVIDPLKLSVLLHVTDRYRTLFNLICCFQGPLMLIGPMGPAFFASHIFFCFDLN